jgi:hypothetical protein
MSTQKSAGRLKGKARREARNAEPKSAKYCAILRAPLPKKKRMFKQRLMMEATFECLVGSWTIGTLAAAALSVLVAQPNGFRYHRLALPEVGQKARLQLDLEHTTQDPPNVPMS